MDNLQLYLTRTGQTYQDVMGGAVAYGEEYIIEQLIPKALKDNKKIVWKEDTDNIDEVLFSFEEI